MCGGGVRVDGRVDRGEGGGMRVGGIEEVVRVG